VRKTIAFAAVSAAALAATPAAAQAVAGAPAGGRVEVVAGYDKVKIDLNVLGVNDSIKDSGVVYGIGAGYDVPLNPTVSVGADVEATKSTAKEDLGFGTELKAGRDLYAGGRVSVAVSPNTNLYAKAGYTNLRLKGEVAGVNDSTNLDGYRLGAGAQVGLIGNAYLGGEYRYSDYESDVSRHQLVATLGTRF
jgi:outer membrane immunogenic protein